MMKHKLILGTVQFGVEYGINNTSGKPTSGQVFEILNHAWNHGISLLDTADAYGNATGLIGSYLFENPNTFRVNTKFKKNSSKISDQCKSSLTGLNIDKIHTYFFHSVADFLNSKELLVDLIEIKSKGFIEKIGISIYSNDEFLAAIHSAEIDVIQLPFNLLDNYSQRGNYLRLAKAMGKEIQVRSIFLQGLFFKPLNHLPKSLMDLHDSLLIVKEISAEFRLPIDLIALNYALQQPEIDHVIIGIDNLHQLKQNLKYSDIKIPDSIIERINNISVANQSLLYPKNW